MALLILCPPVRPLNLHQLYGLNYGIESKLQELSRWCLNFYIQQEVGPAAVRFKQTVSRFLPDYESAADAAE